MGFQMGTGQIFVAPGSLHTRSTYADGNFLRHYFLQTKEINVHNSVGKCRDICWLLLVWNWHVNIQICWKQSEKAVLYQLLMEWLVLLDRPLGLIGPELPLLSHLPQASVSSKLHNNPYKTHCRNYEIGSHNPQLSIFTKYQTFAQAESFKRLKEPNILLKNFFFNFSSAFSSMIIIPYFPIDLMPYIIEFIWAASKISLTTEPVTLVLVSN